MSLLNFLVQNLTTDILKQLAGCFVAALVMHGDISFFPHDKVLKRFRTSLQTPWESSSFLFSHPPWGESLIRSGFSTVKDQWIYFPCGNLQKLGRSWIWFWLGVVEGEFSSGELW